MDNNKQLPLKYYAKLYAFTLGGMLFLWLIEPTTILHSTAGYTPARFWLGMLVGSFVLVLITYALIRQLLDKNAQNYESQDEENEDSDEKMTQYGQWSRRPKK